MYACSPGLASVTSQLRLSALAVAWNNQFCLLAQPPWTRTACYRINALLVGDELAYVQPCKACICRSPAYVCASVPDARKLHIKSCM